MFVQFVIFTIEDTEVIGMICEECRKLTKWKSSSSSSLDEARESEANPISGSWVHSRGS